jgi:hypothetical protein
MFASSHGLTHSPRLFVLACVLLAACGLRYPAFDETPVGFSGRPAAPATERRARRADRSRGPALSHLPGRVYEIPVLESPARPLAAGQSCCSRSTDTELTTPTARATETPPRSHDPGNALIGFAISLEDWLLPMFTAIAVCLVLTGHLLAILPRIVFPPLRNLVRAARMLMRKINELGA